MSDSIRRLAAQIVGLKRDVLHLQTAPRAGQTSIEHGGAITVVDPETGTATARLGTQTDGTYGAVTLDGPIPPIPSVPILDVAPGLVAVTWDGTHADGAATPLDFYTVEVYVAAEPFAFIEEGTLSGSLVGSDGDRITIALAPGVWHVGLVTVSQAMKRSRLSSLAIATVSALPSDEDIALAGGRVTISDDEPEVADAEGKPDSALWQQVVDDVLVGAWRLDAAVPEWRPIEVAPGTPYMPKIDLGSATVGLLTGARLAADAIDGKTITGATVQSSALANRGVKMDSGGLRAFSNTGVRTVNIDSATGAAEFVGGFKTATTGRRIELGPDPVAPNRGALSVYDEGNILRGRISVNDTGQMNVDSTTMILRGANSVSIQAGGTGGEIFFRFYDTFQMSTYRRWNNPAGRWEFLMNGAWVADQPISGFLEASRTTNLTGITTTEQWTGLALSPVRTGRVRLTVSVTTYSTSVTDLVAVRIRRVSADGTTAVTIKETAISANSSNTAAGTGHSQTFFVMDNFFTPGERYDVTILRAFGSGTITLAASANNPASFTLEHV